MVFFFAKSANPFATGNPVYADQDIAHIASGISCTLRYIDIRLAGTFDATSVSPKLFTDDRIQLLTTIMRPFAVKTPVHPVLSNKLVFRHILNVGVAQRSSPYT